MPLDQDLPQEIEGMALLLEEKDLVDKGFSTFSIAQERVEEIVKDGSMIWGAKVVVDLALQYSRKVRGYASITTSGKLHASDLIWVQ